MCENIPLCVRREVDGVTVCVFHIFRYRLPLSLSHGARVLFQIESSLRAYCCGVNACVRGVGHDEHVLFSQPAGQRIRPSTPVADVRVLSLLLALATLTG